MDGSKTPDEQGTQTRKVPAQVEKMLASAKEMEVVLTQKLTKIDAISLEKSEMAKQEATKIKADVEEIKRLSLIQTKEGEDALKAKIMEVNQRIEATTRKAAELQSQLVEIYKELYEALSNLSVGVKKNIYDIQQLAEVEKNKMAEAVDSMVNQAKEQYGEAGEIEKKVKELQNKVANVKFDKNMSKEDVLNKLDAQLELILKRTDEEKVGTTSSAPAAQKGTAKPKPAKK